MNTVRKYFDVFLLKLVKPESLQSLKQFMLNVSSLACFFVGAKVFSVSAGIIAARVLSKDDLGVANLAMTAGNALATLGVFGFGSAIVKYGAPSSTPGRFISTGMWTVIIATAGFAALAMMLSPFAHMFKMSSHVYICGLGMGAFSSLFAFAAAGQQTLSRFSLRGVMELSLAISYAVILCTVFLFGFRSWESIAYSWMIAYSIALFIGVFPMRKECSFGFQKDAFKTMLPFALPTFGGAIGFFFCGQIQRFELSALMTEEDVATYSVYYAPSVVLATFVWCMISTVFFTKSATTSNRENLWNMTARASVMGAIPAFLTMFSVTAFYIYLCGDKYPFDWILATLFTTAATITAIASGLGQVIGAHGVRAVRIGLAMSLTMGVITTVGTWVMLRYTGLGLYATPIAIIAAYTTNLVWLCAIRKSFF